MNGIDQRRLKLVLAARRLSQKDLAKLLGVRGNTLSSWLSGTRARPADWVDRIETALEVRGALGSLDSGQDIDGETGKVSYALLTRLGREGGK